MLFFYAGIEERKDVVHILQEIDLDDMEKIVSQPYHSDVPGRPPRSPIGIFKALTAKRLRYYRSDRELYHSLKRNFYKPECSVISLKVA